MAKTTYVCVFVITVIGVSLYGSYKSTFLSQTLPIATTKISTTENESLFPQTEFDIGSIIENGEHLIEVPYFNNSPSLIKNVNVSTSCACTVASQVPDEIQSGSGGRILVRLRTKGKDGRITTVVRVKFSHNHISHQQAIRIHAVVRPRVRLIADPKILDLGELYPGEEFNTRLRIAQSSWALEHASMKRVSGPNWMHLESITNGATKETVIKIRGIAPSIGGRFSNAIRIHTDANQRAFEIPIVGVVTTEVHLKPTSIVRVLDAGDSHSEVLVKVFDEDRRIVEEVTTTIKEIQGGSIQTSPTSDGALVVQPVFRDENSHVLRGRLLVSVSFAADEAEKIWLPFMFIRRR